MSLRQHLKADFMKNKKGCRWQPFLFLVGDVFNPPRSPFFKGGGQGVAAFDSPLYQRGAGGDFVLVFHPGHFLNINILLAIRNLDIVLHKPVIHRKVQTIQHAAP